MAAIEQIIQIASNERTAGAAQTRADAAVRPTEIMGAGVRTTTVSGRTIFNFDRFNLSNAHTFATPTTRNAGFPYDGGSQTSADIEWTVGDIAIISTTGDITIPGTTPTPSSYSVLSVPSATTFIIAGAYDRANNEFRSDIPDAGNIVRFDEGGNRLSGSTSGGTDFQIVSRARTNPGNDQVTFTVNRSLSAVVPAVDGAETVLIGSSPTTTEVMSGTYVYTGATTGTTHTGATVNNDWVLLEAPGGAASSADLATFSLDGGATTSRLEAVEFDSGNSRLVFINAAGTTTNVDIGSGGVNTRRFYRYSGTTLTITGLDPADTGNQTFTVATPGNWTATNGGTAPTATWPQSASLYANGLKLTYGATPNGDWVFDGTRANLTITITQEQRRELGLDEDGNPETRTLNLEMETLEE